MIPISLQEGWFPVSLVLWLGLCFGSFSNVLIYRLPRNLSVVGPRSFCPGCRRTVAWYDNIPLLSWLLLRGKCRHCGIRISPQYLLVELAGAACALIGIWSAGFTLVGLSIGVFLLLLFNVAVIDWGHMIIPHTLTVAGMILGLVFGHFALGDLGDSIIGLLVGGGIILVVSHGYQLIRGVPGMGGGDVMLMGMIGAFLGVWGALGVLFGGALLGSLFALTVGRGRLNGTAKLPFGTFLALAAGVAQLFGEGLFSWYMSKF
ncbi:MAG: prepilin peptidase [Gemmatimonadales bacterium]|nr:prepilin peptidase [Gemmatimonadales bacterium]